MAEENKTAKSTEKPVKKKAPRETVADKLKKELAEKNDLLIRTAAEFDNFKKRTDREKANVSEYAKCEVFKKLLPIIDNIGRASAADKESADYLKGIEMIVKQFENLCTELALEEIAEVGDEFDPNLHEAVMHIEDESLNENVVAEVLQQGYKYGNTVIRAAMVKVAN